MSKEKVRENRLRRMAERQGMKLHKIKRHDPLALDYGTCYLVDIRSNAIIFPASYSETGIGATVDEIEKFLTKR
ncbi:MAG: hypothetical protein K9K64_10005 [Desulfohalobiaceae bacterium]|nr:hypothetical protein [Desulfohalobiaceae bacterium]